MAESLKQQTAKGVLWSAIERYSAHFVRFILGLILARILTPSDYGLIGMLSIFIAISISIAESGFSSALIQKNNCSDSDFSTAFYFNILVGVLLYLILFLCSPLIASFYETPILIPLTKVIGINIIFSAFSIVPKAKFLIRIDFKTQAKVSLISVITGGGVGITMALNGYGVWALTGQSLTRLGLYTILLFYYAKWKPKLIITLKSFKQLSAYGFRIMGAGILNTLFANIYLLIIGKEFSAVELGHYTRAKQFKDLPSSNFSEMIQSVSFPVLSKIKDDKEKLQKAFKKITKLTIFIIVPIMILMILIADPLIRVVLTDKWIGAVPLLKIICISGIFNPINGLNMGIFKVLGRTDIFFRLTIARHVITIIVIAITLPIGINAILWGQVGLSVINFFINSHYASKYSNHKPKEQLADILKAIMISTPAIIVGYLLLNMIDSSFIQLITIVPVSIICYCTISHILRVPEWIEIIRNRNIFKQ
ncbi:MAG: lipopolysaccharide biosynthesis protein [Bacteroidia bacterium]|nr:lipopolysaccharide biosynthesis protein [Bacteroidia bacterium]